MVEDRAPDEDLDVCLYVIDVRLAELRANIAALKRLEGSTVLSTEVLNSWILWLEQLIEEGRAAQDAILRQ